MKWLTPFSASGSLRLPTRAWMATCTPSECGFSNVTTWMPLPNVVVFSVSNIAYASSRRLVSSGQSVSSGVSKIKGMFSNRGSRAIARKGAHPR